MNRSIIFDSKIEVRVADVFAFVRNNLELLERDTRLIEEDEALSEVLLSFHSFVFSIADIYKKYGSHEEL